MPPLLDVTLTVGVLGGVTVVLGHTWQRVTRLENQLERENRRINSLWLVYRQLVDLYYRYRRPESPEPPKLEELWKETND